jgi:ABC-type multidrug transport system ATPase subunit
VSAPILEARGVYKRYGRRAVLQGATLEAHAGENIAVLGENGGGKSTLLRILAGMLRMDRGEVLRHVATGYCPQDCALYPHLTPDEHMELFARAYGLPGPVAEARAGALFDRFGFARERRRVVHELSGGTRQKLNLALALLHDPGLLLLDEPYNGFDVETYRSFLAFAEEATRAGTGIVLVTHIAFDRDLFHRVLHLKGGVLDEDTPR